MRLRTRRRTAGPGRRILDLLLALAILGLLAVLSARIDRFATESHAGVPRVSDGDSLSFGRERVRLRGIDAPEFAQTCRRDGADYACGRRAREALAGLIDGRAVVCAGSQRDIHHRLLATCRVGEVDINRRMVAIGWAVAYGEYADEEESARRSGSGMWAGSFERPREWRQVHGGLVESEHAGLAQIGAWLRQALRFL